MIFRDTRHTDKISRLIQRALAHLGPRATPARPELCDSAHTHPSISVAAPPWHGAATHLRLPHGQFTARRLRQQQSGVLLHAMCGRCAAGCPGLRRARAIGPRGARDASSERQCRPAEEEGQAAGAAGGGRGLVQPWCCLQDRLGHEQWPQLAALAAQRHRIAMSANVFLAGAAPLVTQGTARAQSNLVGSSVVPSASTGTRSSTTTKRHAPCRNSFTPKRPSVSADCESQATAVRARPEARMRGAETHLAGLLWEYACTQGVAAR